MGVTNMRNRHIKFALELRGGEQARSLEELREYFDIEKIIGYYQDGKLQTWLEDRFYDEEADAVRKLTSKEKNIGERLCEIFNVEYKGRFEKYEEPETIAWRNGRVEKLKQYTADTEVIDSIDCVAFDQDDLEEILNENNIKVVYLCQNKFVLTSEMLRKGNMKYVGVGKNVEIALKHQDNLSLPGLNIVVENIKIIDNMSRTDKRPINSDWKSTQFLAELIYNLYSNEVYSCDRGNSRVYFFQDKTLEGKCYRWDKIILPNERLLCIMIANRSIYFGLNALCIMYVLFTNNAVYYVREDNGHSKRVCYSEIENVVVEEGNNSLDIYKKWGEIDKFPCNSCWLRAMRWFLMIAADKRSVLFENNNRLFNMKFESLDGKSIGDTWG